jgi:hypothetical protein
MSFIECKVKLMRTDGYVILTATPVRRTPLVNEPIDAPADGETVKAKIQKQVKGTREAGLHASRAVMEIFREAASILRERADSAFHTGTAAMEARVDANFDGAGGARPRMAANA